MKRNATVFLVLAAVPFVAAGQSNPLNAQQLEGMRHFNQSCRVCHIKPQLASPQYAPVLSSVSLGGQAEAMKVFVANGTPKMPGFRYHFKPAEIEAIVAYLKTVPQPSD
jgi:mono/diheme cytochrome c family protein